MALMKLYVGDLDFYQPEWNSSNVGEEILNIPFRVNIGLHHTRKMNHDTLQKFGFDFPDTLAEPSKESHLQEKKHHSISKRCAGIGIMGALLPMLLFGLTSLLYSRILIGGFGNTYSGGRYILVPVYYYSNYGYNYPDYYYYYYSPPRRSNNIFYYDYLNRQKRQQRRVQPLNQGPSRVVYVRAGVEKDSHSIFISNDTLDLPEVSKAAVMRQSPMLQTQPQRPQQPGRQQMVKPPPGRQQVSRQQTTFSQPQKQAQYSREGQRNQYKNTRAAQPIMMERTPQKAMATGVGRSYAYSPPKTEEQGKRTSPQKSFLIQNSKKGGNFKRQTNWLG